MPQLEPLVDLSHAHNQAGQTLDEMKSPMFSLSRCVLSLSFFLISSLLFFNDYLLYIFVFFPVHRTRVILLQVTSHWISTLMNHPSSCLLTGVTTSVRPITAPSPWNHRPTTRISAKRIPIRRLTVTPRPTNVALPCIIASSNLCSRKFWAKKKPGTAPSKPNYLFPAFLRVRLVLLIASFFLSLSASKMQRT